MRKIVVTEFLSVDGVMETPERWVSPFWSDETGKYKLDEMFESGALLLGRATYEIFAASWPSRTDADGFADRMNEVPKHVVSSTLTKPRWNNSSIIDGNLAAEITKLKELPGRNILVAGSRALVNFLLQKGLADEYRLMIIPTILGSGKRLFSIENPPSPLNLIATVSLPKGVTVLTYAPAT